LDVEKLEELTKIALHWGIDPQNLIDDMENPADINEWIYTLMGAIFYTIMDEVRKYIVNKNSDYLVHQSRRLETLYDNFEPHINYYDSRFNNMLDNINLLRPKMEVVKDIAEKLAEA
jgi:hypothetical protein